MQRGTTGQRYNVKNRRNKTLNLRISATEERMIKEKAKILNTSIVDFIIEACDNRRVKGFNKKTLKDLKED